jgi:hypothetical protein
MTKVLSGNSPVNLMSPSPPPFLNNSCLNSKFLFLSSSCIRM